MSEQAEINQTDELLRELRAIQSVLETEAEKDKRENGIVGEACAVGLTMGADLIRSCISRHEEWNKERLNA